MIGVRLASTVAFLLGLVGIMGDEEAFGGALPSGWITWPPSRPTLLTDASPPPALLESAGGLATDPAGWERHVTGFLAPALR